MKGEAVIEFALGLSGAVEDHPFGWSPDVYKVGGHIFAILRGEAEPPIVSLKCEPTLAIELREKYDEVTPGYHLNKKHWNTIILDGAVPDAEIEDMIRHSYQQVLAKLPKAVREEISS